MLGFVPPTFGLLRREVAAVPPESFGLQRVTNACTQIRNFASGLTAPLGETRPKRLVGIAAPQVGINMAIVYVNVTVGGEWTDDLRLLINPRILRTWGEDEPVDWWHGCYSTGVLVSFRSLPRYVEIEYYDEMGVRHTWIIDGRVDGPRQLHVVRHEIEHLLGIRHVDAAIQTGAPICVVEDGERPAFDALFHAGGRMWPRTVPPTAWYEMLAGRPWRHLIEETA